MKLCLVCIVVIILTVVATLNKGSLAQLWERVSNLGKNDADLFKPPLGFNPVLTRQQPEQQEQQEQQEQEQELGAQLGGRVDHGSKCFSCEAQDRSNRIQRSYGSKCFSCEAQDRSNGVHRAYGSKCYSCE